ncbi:MAG TPA: C45 family peptidase [Actinomycetota bacterium]|nr:C45 family peptidase [Actinomycetota bacterium]
MAPPTIPVLRVAGSHREVGAQIGAACAETFRRAVAFDHTRIPGGRTRADQLALADRYRDAAYAAYPWYRDELEGAAEAAGVEPRALFACVVEEIWYEPYARRLSGRCTDVVAVPPATRDDHVLVAHNNDMPRSYQDELVALEIAVAGEPTVFAVGNGVWLSCGWNDAGISMTGNELAPLDERVGVPREVQFRSMLRQPTLERAVGDALRHDRASSYNQVLVTRLGEVVNIEGSATDAELLGADEYGHLVHTNHYVCPSMTRYEGDPAYAERSAKRYARAAELLARAGPATITADALRAVLSDHEGAPDAVCRHPERSPESSSSGTTFWWIADLTEGFVRFGRGNPCDSIPQEHRFSPAEESAA